MDNQYIKNLINDFIGAIMDGIHATKKAKNTVGFVTDNPKYDSDDEYSSPWNYHDLNNGSIFAGVFKVKNGKMMIKRKPAEFEWVSFRRDNFKFHFTFDEKSSNAALIKFLERDEKVTPEEVREAMPVTEFYGSNCYNPNNHEYWENIAREKDGEIIDISGKFNKTGVTEVTVEYKRITDDEDILADIRLHSDMAGDERYEDFINLVYERIATFINTYKVTLRS